VTIDYLALAGEDHAIRSLLNLHVPKRRHCSRMNRAIDEPGFVLFASPGTPVQPLANDLGAIVGKLFDAKGDGVGSFDAATSELAVKSGGRSLIDHFWGNYVALLRQGATTIVLRDPSAAVPAYRTANGPIQFYCSSLDLAEGLSVPSGIDEEFVRQWLTFPFLRTSRTGLSQWHELLPGTTHSSAAGTASLWTPAASTRSVERNSDFDEAARLVRRTALATIGRLVADVPSPLLELSGGLDSSIVAAALHAKGIAYEAVNFATRQPDGNERNYANEVAAHFGITLTGMEEDDRPLDLEPPPPALRPRLSPVLQPLDRARQALVGSRAGSSFITGAGGDNIFCYLATTAPILDAVKGLGLGQAAEVARDVADLGDCTVFKAFRFAVRKQLMRRFRPIWPSDQRFLAAEGIASDPDHHPWLDGLAGLPAGTAEHIASLIRAQHFLEPCYHWGTDVHHPLLNQPLIEACLSIPSWQWVRQGRNRAVAREAFSGLLPASIVNRRTKGRLESMCARAFVENRRRIATLLLDGDLAGRGIIDRPSVEAYLLSVEPPTDDDYFRVFDLVSMELWLQSWR
jgi:asparagine synthase (glutamine-hydrolysing)